MNEIPKISLYEICRERVKNLLKKGTWKQCAVNPFSNLPSRIVDDVMELLQYGRPSVSQAVPLFTSGSLTRLNLSRFDLEAESYLFLELIQKNSFRFLRFLTWSSLEDNTIPLIETLIRSCPRLEEFHSWHYIPIDAFQNCKELRVLNAPFPDLISNYKLSYSGVSVLTSLRNLQKVHFYGSMDIDLMANILKYCPQLISLGFFDSLHCLEEIHAIIAGKCEIDGTEVFDHFQLTKCVWGKNNDEMKSMASEDVTLYKSSFPEKTRIAVSLCPFVQELVIYVSHPDSIESLKNLKMLANLQISFKECDQFYDCMTNLIALLKVIGPRLKYLSVNTRHPVPVDIVCDCCPRLEDLGIVEIATASGSVQFHNNVFLTKLRILKIDQNVLLFLLTYCKSLVELFIFDAVCLDDSLLDQILSQNPLERLKVMRIIQCSLSKVGFRMILEKLKSLELVHFEPFRQNIVSMVKDLIKELHLTNVIHFEKLKIPFNEHL